MSYDSEEARGEAGDEIFAGSSTDNGVVSTGNSRAVISSNHQAHLNELASIPRQPAHKEGHNNSNAVQGFLQEFLKSQFLG